MIKKNLEGAGHLVYTAEDWPEARKHLRTLSDIDLVIIDVVIPGFQNGAEMARSLKVHPKLRDSKIIFYSSKNHKFLERQSKLLRLDGYIHKERSGNEFVNSIHEIIFPTEDSQESEKQDSPPVKPMPKLSPEMRARLLKKK